MMSRRAGAEAPMLFASSLASQASSHGNNDYTLNGQSKPLDEVWEQCASTLLRGKGKANLSIMLRQYAQEIDIILANSGARNALRQLLSTAAQSS